MVKAANLEKMELFALGKSQGKSSAALAQELEISPQTASNWLKDPRVQKLITDAQVERWQEAQNMLLNVQKLAVQTLVVLMKSDDERIRLSAAKEILTQAASFPSYL
jgi:transposase-like protein